MILQEHNNGLSVGNSGSGIRLMNEPYLFLNIFFAGVILMIMVYSGIFSPVKNNYPVACIHEQLTGMQCVSCGLSHSFSLIMQGEFNKASEWNAYGMRVFIFFASQFILRIIFSILYVNRSWSRRRLVLTDSFASGLMFLIAFMPFLRWMIIMITR